MSTLKLANASDSNIPLVMEVAFHQIYDNGVKWPPIYEDVIYWAATRPDEAVQTRAELRESIEDQPPEVQFMLQYCNPQVQHFQPTDVREETELLGLQLVHESERPAFLAWRETEGCYA